jgi:hypothetical protein
MVWVKFREPFNFTPAAKRAVTMAYKPDGKAGGEYNVTRECVERARAAGVKFDLLKDSDDGSIGEGQGPGQVESASATDAEDRPATDDGSSEDERAALEGSGDEGRPGIDWGTEADDPILRGERV